jgi:HAD superfamily hydrolase (TIGR01493 family)
MKIKCIAFDCFGTVFDMSSVSRDEIKAYVEHVRKSDFSPFQFSKSWWNLKPYPDSRRGLELLRGMGFECVTLSNGDAGLLGYISRAADLPWSAIIDLASHKFYKPHVMAYRAVEKDRGFKPEETLMVTANPTFGDIEGAAAIGMPSQVIRHGHPNTVIELAEMLLKAKGEA